MFKTKSLKLITTFMLLLVMSMSLIVPAFIKDRSREEVATRDINVEELAMLSYEDKAEEILSNFDSYEISNSASTISLEAEVDLSGSTILDTKELSSAADKTIKKYSVDLDTENEKFYIVVQYLQDDVIVYEERVETTPYYDEYMDDYYVDMPDGTTISMYETLTTSNLEECCATLVIAGVALTTAEAAALIAAFVIVATPVIVQVVTVVVETIITWVKSFWSWFKSLWTAKTTTKTTKVVTTTISYTVSIAQTKVDVKKYEKERKFNKGKYYVAIGDTVDGFLYVSDVEISEAAAIAILTSEEYVRGATKDKYGKYPQLVISIYTPSGTDALKVALSAGTLLGIPGVTHHKATRPGYFDHYHPGSVYTHPHAFYGTPLK